MDSLRATGHYPVENLLEQHGYILVQIDAPICPSVAAGAESGFVVNAHFREQRVKVLAAFHADVVRLSTAHIIELHARFLQSLQLIGDIVPRSHAEYADIAEYIRMAIGGRQRMSATHREASDCPAILFGDYAVVLF